MFADNGSIKEMGTSNQPNNSSNRYTKIGNILQDYIDEENDESNKDNNRGNSEINNKKNSNKKITKYKVILLGEPGVGKTSIINKYIFNKFESTPILQDENESDKNIKMIDIDDNKSVESIIIFDVGNKDTFNKVKYWLKEINNYAPKDIIICILGNKTDVPSASQINIDEVKTSYGDNLCYEVSAKDGNNISLAFEQLTFKIIKEQKKRKREQDVVLRGSDGRKSINLSDISVKNTSNAKKSKCC